MKDLMSGPSEIMAFVRPELDTGPILSATGEFLKELHGGSGGWDIGDYNMPMPSTMVTPADCKPGTVVQWGDYVGVVQESSLAASTALAMGLIEPGECVGVRSDAGHHLVAPAALTLAPRFLVGGEWVGVRNSPKRLMAAIDFAEPEHPSLPAWIWAKYDWDTDTVLRNYAPTFAAARQAVERACGIGTTDMNGENNGN